MQAASKLLCSQSSHLTSQSRMRDQAQHQPFKNTIFTEYLTKIFSSQDFEDNKFAKIGFNLESS